MSKRNANLNSDESVRTCAANGCKVQFLHPASGSVKVGDGHGARYYCCPKCAEAALERAEDRAAQAQEAAEKKVREERAMALTGRMLADFGQKLAKLAAAKIKGSAFECATFDAYVELFLQAEKSGNLDLRVEAMLAFEAHKARIGNFVAAHIARLEKEEAEAKRRAAEKARRPKVFSFGAGGGSGVFDPEAVVAFMQAA